VLKKYPRLFRGEARLNPRDPAAPDHLVSLTEKLRILAIRLLLAYPLRTDFRGVPNPQLKLQLGE